jgi:asparagine synthase (glutamine-hydrolysing)
MLDGIGGDDLLAVDIDHLTDFIVQGKIWKLMLQLRYDSTLYSSSVLTLLLNYCLKPLIPQSIRTFIKQILRMVRGNGIPMWINGAVPKQVDIVERVGVKQSVIRFPTHAQQHMYQGLRCGWNVNIVQDIADRFAAIFGIEKRYPFFDRRLIEFSFGLPDEQRWGKKGSKAILRNGMKEILPDAIRNRIDKTEFSPLIDHELKQRQCDKLNVLLRSSILKSFGLINVNELGRQLCDYRQEIAKNNVRYDLEKFIWLETWLSPTIGRS